MEENMDKNLKDKREGISTGELMTGAAFAIVLMIILKNLGFGMIIAGAIGGGLGMGLGMLVIRAVKPKNNITEE